MLHSQKKKKVASVFILQKKKSGRRVIKGNSIGLLPQKRNSYK